MRQIKFRAWDKNKNEIRCVTGINWYDEYIWVDETPMSGDKISIENTPLMQFTGLTDKNGKDIYEGDIVKELSDGRIHEIERYPDRLFHFIGEGMFNPKNCEVIGNVFENKDLLV